MMGSRIGSSVGEHLDAGGKRAARIGGHKATGQRPRLGETTGPYQRLNPQRDRFRRKRPVRKSRVVVLQQPKGAERRSGLQRAARLVDEIDLAAQISGGPCGRCGRRRQRVARRRVMERPPEIARSIGARG